MGVVYLSVGDAGGKPLPEFPKFELRVEGPAPLDWHTPPSLATWGKDFIFTYDDNAQALEFRLSAGGDSRFWPLEPARLEAKGDGSLERKAGPQFEVRRLGDAVSKAHSVAARVSRLRDVTGPMIAKLNTIPPAGVLRSTDHNDRISAVPIPGGAPVKLAEFTSFHAKKVAAGSTTWQFEVERQSVTPKLDVRILEVKGKSVPRLVGVAWPESLKGEIDEVPFFVMIRNRVGATADYQGYDKLLDPATSQEAYSKGWGFLAYGFWQWLCYQWDPLVGDPEPPARPEFTGSGRARGSMIDTRMGFAYQIEAAKKNVVLVMPFNRPESQGPGHGEFLSAGSAHDLLREIAAFMLGQKGLPAGAQVGRTAFGGFSSGHLALAQFVENSEKEILARPAGPHADFYSAKLREMYFFDPPVSKGAGLARHKVIQAGLRWAKGDPGKILRLYAEAAAPADDDLIAPPPAGSPNALFRSSADGNRTVTRISAAEWIKARKALMSGEPPARVLTDQAASNIDHPDGPHPLFCALFLKDALERSRFADAGS